MTSTPGLSSDDDPARSAPAGSRSAGELGAAELAARLRASGELTAAELAARLRASGELTAAELATLYRLDGGWLASSDDSGYDRACDDDSSCYDADLGFSPRWADLAVGDPHETRTPEVLEAGFTHRYGGPGRGSRPAGRWTSCCPARTWPGTSARSARPG
jgi:hypothetical protein